MEDYLDVCTNTDAERNKYRLWSEAIIKNIILLNPLNPLNPSANGLLNCPVKKILNLFTPMPLPQIDHPICLVRIISVHYGYGRKLGPEVNCELDENIGKKPIPSRFLESDFIEDREVVQAHDWLVRKLQNTLRRLPSATTPTEKEASYYTWRSDLALLCARDILDWSERYQPSMRGWESKVVYAFILGYAYRQSVMALSRIPRSARK